MSCKTTAEEQRNVIELTKAFQEEMMSVETTADQCVHVPQQTMALPEECCTKHYLSSFSDDDNGNTVFLLSST